MSNQEGGAGIRTPAGFPLFVREGRLQDTEERPRFIADGAMTVLQVLASADYDPHDDVYILRSRWVSEGAPGDPSASVGAQE